MLFFKDMYLCGYDTWNTYLKLERPQHIRWLLREYIGLVISNCG